MRPRQRIAGSRSVRAGAAAAVAAETAARASVSALRARSAAILVGVVLAGCALVRPVDRSLEIEAALGDLRRAGFEFAPDVRFVHDPIAVCDGIRCADLVVVSDRRTIRLATTAFASRSKLCASLLEIWPRYTMPRRADAAALARSAWLVASEGQRAGVDDPEVLGEARFAYRQLWHQATPAERASLPSPESLPTSGR